MYYEINVSKDGIHFFATSERSINMQSTLEKFLRYLLRSSQRVKVIKSVLTNMKQ